MDIRYDVRQATRYVLVHESDGENASSSDDLAQFWRRDQAEMAGKALAASPGLHREHELAMHAEALRPQPLSVRERGLMGLSRIAEPSGWTHRYDVKQVTRYVLYRVSGDESADICEFGRRDEANAVLNAIKGAAGDGVPDDHGYSVLVIRAANETKRQDEANRAANVKYAGQGQT